MALFGRESREDQARAQAWARWMQAQNPFAVASLVLGVFSLIEFGVIGVFGVAGIVTGFVALVQLRRAGSEAIARNKGHGLAWAGIVTSAVSLVLALLLYLRVFG